jgi:hypothetical protein
MLKVSPFGLSRGFFGLREIVAVRLFCCGGGLGWWRSLVCGFGKSFLGLLSSFLEWRALTVIFVFDAAEGCFC